MSDPVPLVQHHRTSVVASLRGWSSVSHHGDDLDFGLHRVTLGVEEMRRFDEDWRRMLAQMDEPGAPAVQIIVDDEPGAPIVRMVVNREPSDAAPDITTGARP